MPSSVGLDHVYLRVQDLDALLAVFHQRLGLPLSWPVREESFARYAWVNAGNVQFEFWQARSNDDLPPGTRLPCIAGLALWPQDIAASREALRLAEVATKDPRTWQTAGADGAPAVNFTNCLVSDASSATCQVFFCQWGDQAPIAPWPKGESTAARRKRFAAALADAGGGAIGLTGLRAVHMESPDPAETARVWRALTGQPSCAAPGVALQISEGPELRITALVLGVSDLQRAVAALTREGMATTIGEHATWIDAPALSGLRIGLLVAEGDCVP